MKKRLFILLAAALMLGVATPTMAQQKKAPAKRTTTTTKKSGTATKGTAAKKTSAKPTVVSIPFEGPAIVDGHLAILGVSLAEDPATMKSKLMAKGLKSRNVYDGDSNLAVQGTVDGVKVWINISIASDKKIWNVIMYDENTYRLPKAKTRFSSLIAKMESIYGKGKYENNEDDHKNYEIETEQGSVGINLFNEDEMDGASDFYVISVGFTERK